MAQFELIMPKMGESVAEATITNWLKNEGDKIDADESVLEIATDKVDSEVPSPVEGTLVKRLFNENDVVQVGQAIAIINTGGDEAPSSNGTAAAEAAPAAVKAVAETVAVAAETASVTTSADGEKISRSSNGRFYSPLVRSIAEAEGIGQAELDKLTGSGLEGRVTKKDILNYIDNRGSAPAPAPAAPALPASRGATPAAAPRAGRPAPR